MTFADPYLLIALVAVPLGLVAYVVFARRGRRTARAAANPALWPNLMPRRPGWRRHVPPVLLLLALASLLVGVARPQALMAERPEADDRRARRRLVELDGCQGRQSQPHRRRSRRGARPHRGTAEEREARARLLRTRRPRAAGAHRRPCRVQQSLTHLTLRGGTALGTAIDRAVASLRASHAGAQGTRDHRDLGRQEHRGQALAASPPRRAAKAAGVRVFTVSLGTAGGTVKEQGKTVKRPARSDHAEPRRGDQRRALLPRHGRQVAPARLSRHRQRRPAPAQEARRQLRVRGRRGGARGRWQPALAGLVPPPDLTGCTGRGPTAVRDARPAGLEPLAQRGCEQGAVAVRGVVLDAQQADAALRDPNGRARRRCPDDSPAMWAA